MGSTSPVTTAYNPSTGAFTALTAIGSARSNPVGAYVKNVYFAKGRMWAPSYTGAANVTSKYYNGTAWTTLPTLTNNQNPQYMIICDLNVE